MTDHASAFIGKWHLGGHVSHGWQPHDQGFEEIAYFDEGYSPYFNWRELWDKRELEFPKMPQTELTKGKAGEILGKEYLTDELTEQAIDFLRKRAALEQDMAKPFFLYLCHFAVHTPFQSQPEDVKYFENKPTRGWHGHDNAVYAAMLKRLEASVGQILDTLQHEGLDENTLVVLMSVNGGVMYTTPLATCNAPCQSGKVTHFEGGIRVPLIFRWKAISTVRLGQASPSIATTSFRPYWISLAMTRHRSSPTAALTDGAWHRFSKTLIMSSKVTREMRSSSIIR